MICRTRKRVIRHIGLFAICILAWGGGFGRTGLSDSATPVPTAWISASPEVIAIVISTPEPTALPSPASTAELSAAVVPTATPLPTPDPAERMREAERAAAARALSDDCSPNRMTQAKMDAVLDTLPEDLPLCRAMIVLKAHSLIGKVPYQYGGKSRALGWDAEWGKYGATVLGGQVYVNSDPNGLDCSGFVRWCFINAAGSVSMGPHIGSGTYKQWLSSEAIAMSDALPGDLVFTNEVGRTNHDGIVVQNDGRGKLMVIHCARDKGVVLERMTESKFRFARRPDVLRGKNLDAFNASVLRHKSAEFMVDLRYVMAVRDI